MSDTEKYLAKLFEKLKAQGQRENENLLSEIRQEMRQLRNRMRSVKCEGCEDVIRQAYNHCKYRCDALRGRVALSHCEWESIFNAVPIYSTKCHECGEYDWSHRGNIGPFTPYEFYRFLRNCSFSPDESIWCYEILTGCRYDPVLGASVYLGEGWLNAFFTFFRLRLQYPQSFDNPTVYGGMTQ